MLLPHCAFASSFPPSEGLEALGLAEAAHFIWAGPSGLGLSPRLGNCSRNNRAQQIQLWIWSGFMKGKAQAFLNTHRYNMDDSSAKSAPLLLEAKLGSKAFWWVTTLQQERMCYGVVETHSLGKVLSSGFLSISPPINSLFALKHSAETVIVLIRARQSPNVRGISDTSVVKMLSL